MITLKKNVGDLNNANAKTTIILHVASALTPIAISAQITTVYTPGPLSLSLHSIYLLRAY
jgi:hypothetical protein